MPIFFHHSNTQQMIIIHQLLIRTAFGMLILLGICGSLLAGEVHQIVPVNFSKVSIQDNFWAPRLKTHSEVTLPVCIKQCEKLGRIAAFDIVAAGIKTPHYGAPYSRDSDPYKVLEGVAYSYRNNPNPLLLSQAEKLIVKIAAAQQPDGYLNTYFSMTAPDQKWTDMGMHEMYCIGHLIEAAVAFYDATGNDKLLNVAIKAADNIDAQFGPGKRHWVEGHQEIELALVKLYHTTKNEKYLKLSNWLLEERGHGYGVGKIWEKKDWGPKYCQDDLPVSAMTDITGHAVRAMYMYTGMADVAAATKNTDYISALSRVWEDVVLRNMYVTGGIGSSKENEGFTEDYDLPNSSAYCETCASVGMINWNHQMNLLSGDGKYVDILERSMYNAALAGISFSGDHFFYVNPLESKGDHHREVWYNTACCPTQMSRFLPSIGNYIYGVSDEGLLVNLYISGTGKMEYKGNQVELKQESNYPWDGHIALSVSTQKKSTFSMKLRIPGWCRNFKLSVNGYPVKSAKPLMGYAEIKREWKEGDKIGLTLDLPIELVASDPKVKEDTGKRAVQRGPLVYCIEEVDNKGNDWDNIRIDPSCTFELAETQGLLNGMTIIKTRNNKQNLTFVPYFGWDNREPGKMKVWMDYHEK